MELRSRSRSMTPRQTEAFIQSESFGGSNHITRSTTRRSLKTTTIASGANSEHSFYSSSSSASKATKSKGARLLRSVFKTSDYSSEEGEDGYMHQLSQNERNQLIEDARMAANGDTEVSALNLYRKAGRYWDKYPKTDYTYSRHSRDRVELAPGVVQMPNMSRRTIHSADSSTNTDVYYTKSILQQQRLFASPNNNDGDEFDGDSYKISRRASSSSASFFSRVTSVLATLLWAAWWCVRGVYQTSNGAMMFVGKKLHHLVSRVMLLDTWLLKKSVEGGRRKTRLMVALCLAPLLFFAAWFLLSSLGSAIYWSYFIPSKPVEPTKITETISSSPSQEINVSQLDADKIIEQILQSPKIYNIINNMNVGKETDENLLKVIEDLKAEINRMKEDFITLEQTKSDALNRKLSQFRAENIRSFTILTQKLNRCCNKNMINLEPHITSIFTKLLNDPEFLTNQKGLSDWLNALFVAKQHLEARLSNLTTTLTSNIDVSVDATANRVMEKVATKLADRPYPDDRPMGEEYIQRIVQSALKVYDADRTGLVDYAMEPLGGQILTTRCTESYNAGTAVISVMGIPIWHPSVSPRIVITPGVNPGECWAFQNFPGFLVIKLASRVHVEAFSVEHVSRLLVPEGRIDSAPKEFEVYGLEDENDKDPVIIGDYVYDYNGESLQFFAAQKGNVTFSVVEVRIKSNHGNPNYTCLYRFRVHGKVSHEPT